MKSVKKQAEIQEAESEKAVEGLRILQSALDWCGELGARVSWYRDRKQQPWVDLRVEDLSVTESAEDPITGLLASIEQMKQRLARRRINAGI